MNPHPLAAAFLEGLAQPRWAEVDEATAEKALAALLEAARAARPSVSVEPARFCRYLGERCRGQARPWAKLQTLAIQDLLLACACLDGDRVALDELDRVFTRAVRGASRVDAAPEFLGEVLQMLRERVLVAPKGGRSRLAEYGGAGTIDVWCKVAAVRIALNLKDGPAREVTLKPELVEVGSDASAVDSIVVKREHRQALAEAFAEATRSLTHEERVLLRYHFVDGLKFEHIAPLFKTHRSTISRRVAAARQKLLDGTKRALRARLGAGMSEISSLLRVAKSELDVDLTAWL